MRKFLKPTIALLVLASSASAMAANVAVYGNNSVGDVPAPHTATAVNLTDIESGGLAAYDVLWIGHVSTSASAWSAEACVALDSFVTAGGGIVTEWNGVVMLFDAMDPGIYYPMPSPQCGFFTGTVANGDYLATNTPIDIVDPASPLVAGLSDPFVMGGGSEFFYTTGIDVSAWDVAAEFTGFGGTWPAIMSSDALGGIVAVGVMDYGDVLPGDANASTLLGNLIEFADTGSAAEPTYTAYFNVTKTFTDGADGDVEVTLTCNGGIPLQQDFTISGGGSGVTFTVSNLPDTGVNCEVTETGGAAGYTPEFNGGSGCSWTGVTGGRYYCEITNSPSLFDFVVDFEWDDTAEEATGTVDVSLYCTNVVNPDGSLDTTTRMSPDNPYVATATTDDEFEWLGVGAANDEVDEDDVPINVTTCWAEATNIDDSAVEVSGCEPFAVNVGDDEANCTMTASVFFEGIPTLSQYGMAIMALLMLGLGFVGFRRFV